jgi:hypothetical protein
MLPMIYVGYDPREDEAYRVAVSSIVRWASDVVRIDRIKLDSLPVLKLMADRPIERRDGKLWCPISQAPMATEFAISRFCVPFLQHDGWALYVDCDIVCLSDIAELFALADDRYAVMCVKHKQESGPSTKMDGQEQTYYARKNWSSVVLWNVAHPAHQRFTIRELQTWPGRYMHAFKWLKDDEIGALSPEWNQLVGVQDKHWDRGILHYTLGTPNMPGYENCLYANVWQAEQIHQRIGDGDPSWQDLCEK